MLVPNYPIQTARLHLRPFQESDLDDLYAYHSRPEVTRFLYWNARTLEETQKDLQRKQADTSLSAEGSYLSLAVVLPESAKVIGQVSLVWRSQEHQQGEIGFVFNPDYGGQGYATEAAQTVQTCILQVPNGPRVHDFVPLRYRVKGLATDESRRMRIGRSTPFGCQLHLLQNTFRLAATRIRLQ